MLSRKKYVVDLSGDEREHLKAVISKGKSAARTILKALILLKADQGRLDGRSKKRSQTAPKQILGHSAHIERGFRGRDGRCSGGLHPSP